MRSELVLDRDIFDESIREIVKRKVVVDLGSSTRFNKQLSKYKPLFQYIHYFAIDINFYPELDIVADIQHLPLRDNCIEAIICKDVLEHVPEPLEVVNEIYRVLNKGGLAFISTPFLYPYHASKTQKDLYRFTKDGLEYMFRKFSKMKLQPCGDYISTLLNFMTGFKLGNCFYEPFLEKPLWILAGFLRKKAVNRLHNPMGFNVLLRK